MSAFLLVFLGFLGGLATALLYGLLAAAAMIEPKPTKRPTTRRYGSKSSH
jgi:purine-cytosine permease-like protein